MANRKWYTRSHKLDQAMTTRVARRMVRTGTKALALFLGSPVLQLSVLHLRKKEWLGLQVQGEIVTRFGQ